jgi:phosphoribosylformylglycinamidine synthase
VARVRVTIIRAAGTNCDLETEHAWQLAGAAAQRVHLDRLAESPAALRACEVVTIPGGFSFGDDIAAGRIFAMQLRRRLYDALCAHVDAGKLLLGICNGFQILVQAGLLPRRIESGQTRRCTVTHNAPAGFRDRWLYLQAGTGPCVFLEPGRRYEMPMAHGEGRVMFASESDLRQAQAAGLDALRYVGPPAGQPDWHGEPTNPNGSQGEIAGLCDSTGRVFGLMPHPERFVTWTQHPCWTSLPARAAGDGLDVFRRATAYFA